MNTESSSTADIHQLQNRRAQHAYDVVRAAGAPDPVLALLRNIADKGTAPQQMIEEVGASANARFSANGASESVLSFAATARQIGAVEELLAAGLEPTGAGLFPLTVVRMHDRDGLERDWSVSRPYLDLYYSANGPVDFSSDDLPIPLFAVALSEGNLMAAIDLVEHGADPWIRERNGAADFAVYVARSYHPESLDFAVALAESGQLRDAPAEAVASLAEFYAAGYFNSAGTERDPWFVQNAPTVPGSIATFLDIAVREGVVERTGDIAKVLDFEAGQTE